MFFDYICRCLRDTSSDQEREKISELIRDQGIPFSSNDGVKIYRSVQDLYSDQPEYMDLTSRLWESYQTGKVQEEKSIAEQLERIAGSLDNISDALCSGSEDTTCIGDSLERISDLLCSVIGDRTMSGKSTLNVYDEGRY